MENNEKNNNKIFAAAVIILVAIACIMCSIIVYCSYGLYHLK